MTFDNLISELNLIHDYLPLWKVVEPMTPIQKDSVVAYINGEVLNGHHKGSYAREVCLLYAYWWQKLADGGIGGQNYDAMPTALGLNVSRALLIEAVKYELQRARTLGIPVYRGQGGSNRWLSSLLAQGGIPVNWLENAENKNNLKKFLEKLYYYFKDNPPLDWTNTAVAEEMAERMNLSQQVQSQAFCGYCMYAVQAALKGDFSFPAAELVTQIVKADAQPRERRQFAVEWFVEVRGNQLNLCYSLRIPQTIAVGNNYNATSRRFYLNEQFVAEYLCFGNRLQRQPGYRIPGHRRVEPDSEALYLEKSDDCKPTQEETLLNSAVPVFDEPMILRDNGTIFWDIDAGFNEPTAKVLYPEDWVPSIKLQSTDKYLNGQTLRCSDIAWANLRDAPLVFSKGDRSIRFRQHDVGYYLNVNFPYLDWINKAGKLLVARTTDIQGCIYVYDSEENLQPRGWSLQMKTRDGYADFNQNRLQNGLNTLCITLPNGRNKFIQFFLVDSITYDARGGGKLTFSCAGVTTSLLEVEGPTVDRDGDVYHCPDNVSVIHFKLYANGSDMNLSVTAPPKESSFWDGVTGQRITNATIPLTSLNRYKVYLRGRSRMRIEMLSNKSERLINISIFWGANQYHNLSLARGVIDKMMDLYPMTFGQQISLLIGNSRITVSPTPYHLARDPEIENCINILDNGTAQRGLVLGAIDTHEILLDDFCEYEITDAKEEGRYFIPEELRTNPFIVYSKDYARKFPPQLIVHGEDQEMADDDRIEARNGMKARSIGAAKAHLQYIREGETIYDENRWRHVWKLFEIVHRDQLPFFAFNSFYAIKDDPRLQLYFITHLRNAPCVNAGTISEYEVLDELERMESELGFAFHCIPRECWKEMLPSILPDMNEDSIQQYLNYYFRLLDNQFGKDNSLAIIMRNVKGESIDCQYTRQPVNAYVERCNGTFISMEGNDQLILPTLTELGDVDIRPNLSLNRCTTIQQKMIFFSIVMPQMAARYARSYDPVFWTYSISTALEKRLINYIRKYARDVYNELFLISFCRH